MGINNQLKVLSANIYLIIFLTGCVTSSNVEFIPAENTSPKFLPDKIQILTAPPIVSYKILGEIRVQGSSKEQLETMLKQKAFEVGADALINMQITGEKAQKAEGTYASSDLLWETKKNKMGVTVVLRAVATAIKFENKPE